MHYSRTFRVVVGKQPATFLVILVGMLRRKFHVRLVACLKVAATRELIMTLLHELSYLHTSQTTHRLTIYHTTYAVVH